MDIDEIDFGDPVSSTKPVEPVATSQEPVTETVKEEPTQQEDEDLVTSLLHSKGIDDVTKIKFEDENGSIKEVPFEELSKEEQLNILQSDETDPDMELNDDEISLINELRQANLSAEEYIEAIKQAGVQEASAANIIEPTYAVDDYKDDDLFIYDQQARNNLSEDEAKDILDTLKSNPTLYKKQVDGIRAEYKAAEDYQSQQALELEQQQQQMDYQNFTNNVVNEIGQLDKIGNIEMDLDTKEKNALASYILDKDQSGVSYLFRALDDPKTLVKMAWFAQYGDKAFTDLDDYISNQVKSVSRAQYDKGYNDGKANIQINKHGQTHVVTKPTAKTNPTNNTSSYKSINDLD